MGIESNIRIGNRYIELLEFEKIKGNSISLENKYGLTYDHAISEATGKTFALGELLNQKAAVSPPNQEKAVAANELKAAEEKIEPAATSEAKEIGGLAKSNRWLIALAAIALLLFSIIYFGSKSSSDSVEAVQTEMPVTLPKMNLEDTILIDYLQEADIQNATLNGIILPAWSELTEDKKKDVLKQMLKLGDAKGYTKIQLVDKENKLIASAANGNVFVLD